MITPSGLTARAGQKDSPMLRERLILCPRVKMGRKRRSTKNKDRIFGIFIFKLLVGLVWHRLTFE
jgi:hypothetical protein